MADITILQNEISLDPLARGYAGMTDVQVANDLNTAYRTRNRESMTASEVLNAIDKAEFDLLLETAKQAVSDILHIGEVNPFGIEADLFVDIFGGSSTTITDLKALRTESITRGDEIGWGLVKVGHVQMARGA